VKGGGGQLSLQHKSLTTNNCPLHGPERHTSLSQEMKGSQGALDWFPSLNLDGLKSMDMDYLLDLSYNNGNNPNAAT